VVTLPRLSSYTEDELAWARALSPAIHRYLDLLQRPEIDHLHQIRLTAWCECGLATLHNRATAAQVCTFWSQSADRILQRAWQECGLENSEALLLSLGKHGAEELNLSSDLDVMIVARPAAVLHLERPLRKFQQRLQHNGEFGFCFRLDFDLRPGGSMGPWITSPSQFQDYYWSQGETWERLALVRLRPLLGDQRLAEQIHDLAERFSFRKFLDYTLLEDLKALRSQIHSLGFDRHEGLLNLKLEVGGIRDIELFVHSLQVLNAGKMPKLRTRSTTLALRRLAETQLLKASEAEFLESTYWWYREVENLLQLVEDRQTHSWSEATQHLPRMPRRDELEARMKQVDSIVSSLLGQVDLNRVHLPPSLPGQQSWLRELGFPGETVSVTWPELMQSTALSYKNDRDERARQEFLYTFVNVLAQHPPLNRDLGLKLLMDFVRATRAKATFYTMLLRSPRLIDDLARLFCLSPYLGSILASRPELLDHFILRVDEDWSNDIATLLEQMHERKLLTEIWSANQFLADRDISGLFARVTNTADEIAGQLLMQLRREFPRSTVQILTMGKWGGQELGLRSDLDFVFVTDSTPNEDDHKVARRWITRLTDPLKGGCLYNVDLRLRPSGQSGALIVPLAQLQEYWLTQAAPWERQAYLRARPLNAELKLTKDALVQKPLTQEDLEELARIRSKLRVTHDETRFDLKHGPGGLIDIEFCAQIALLKNQMPVSETSTVGMIEQLAARLKPWKEHGPTLIQAYWQLRSFEQRLQLASAHRTNTAVKSELEIAARLFEESSEIAWKRLEELLRTTRERLGYLEL